MTSIILRRCILNTSTFALFRRSCVVKESIISSIKYHNITKNQTKLLPQFAVSFYSTELNKPKNEKDEKIIEDEMKNLGLFKKFKLMYRDYWYVLVPVHLITSIGWFGGFYYMAKSGVDIVSLLQSIGFSEKLTNPLKDSSMGYIAVAYALYKIATPIRYTVTLGGTTLSINYLKGLGYIKPVPSKEKLKEMYNVKKESFKETFQETKEELRQRKDQLKERKDNIVGDYVNFKKELKDIKTKNTTIVKPLPQKAVDTEK